MKKRLPILLSLMFVAHFTMAQSNCKVKLEDINKSYIGECKKGYANGQGEAKGEKDSYKGAFKKGLPHGYGTYKWGNGNVYIGEFTKGAMDGKGRLTIKDDSGKITVQHGFFERGTYLGEYKHPYNIISKREIKNIYIREDASIITLPGINIIKVSFRYNGRQIMPSQIDITDDGKSIIEREGNFMVLKNVQFPNKKIEISFRTEVGFNGRVTLDIYKKGNWAVEITI